MSEAGGVSLGGIELTGFEVPERITYGGTERMAEHHLPGGGTVVDLLGPSERDITWSGMMIGTDAIDRALALDQLRQSGATVLLLFGSLARKVIVVQFEAEYRRAWWVGQYRIRCFVVPVLPPALESAAGDIAGDLSAAIALDPTVSAAVGSAQSALSVVGVLTAGAPGTVALTVSLNNAAASAAARQSAADASLAQQITAMAGNGGVIGGPPTLQDLAGTAAISAKSTCVSCLLARANRNVNLADG
jgi:hypothetical protein